MASKRILIVDDEPQFIEVVKLRLESRGYSVIAAANGKECLEAIKTDKPNAILLDIMMPERDGLETLQEIKKIDTKLPVFMVTASLDQEKFDEATKLGASGFIAKTSDLSNEIESIISSLNMADKFKGDKDGEANG